MRIANVAGRLAVVDGERAIDVERASAGLFAADPQAIYADWDAFRAWAAAAALPAGEPFTPDQLGPPVPRPSQVFAIGLNYDAHAAEVDLVDDGTSGPPVFTKFPSCLTGPFADVVHPGGSLDWEVELVVVIGRHCRHVPAADGWSSVAGLTVGQDLSERILQHEGRLPQFSLGKSYEGFGPIGPWVVTPDELENADDIELWCEVNGERVQHATTRQLIQTVPQLVARLSSITGLLPGDIIFSGTPAGVGLAHMPPRFLSAGDVIVSHIAGIGEMRTRIVAHS
ncbi:MAG: fumarylacetoacetate hydrolase family protein [Gaiellales bacterium]